MYDETCGLQQMAFPSVVGALLVGSAIYDLHGRECKVVRRAVYEAGAWKK